MSHLTTSRLGAASTPPEWLAVGAQIGQFVNERAQRHDVVAFLGQGAGQGAPAAYNITLAEIELDRATVFGEHIKPTDVGDFTERSTLFEWPVGAGALIHEAGHARWSTWDMEPMVKLKGARKGHDRKVARVIELFEETRMERQCALTWPADRAFLRACALKLVMGDDLDLDGAKAGNKFALSTLLLLTTARVDAGVLDPADVQAIRDGAVSVFGEPLVNQFHALWVQAQAVVDHRHAYKPLLKLAEEWVDLLDEFAPEEQEQGPGEPAPGEGGGSGMPQELQDMLDALGSGELGDIVEVAAAGEAADQESAERREAQAQAENADARERHEMEDTATQVFGKGTEDVIAGTSSRIVEKREPTGPERAAAVIVARELEKAKYRDRDATDIHSALPPGRLKTRAAIQGAADRSAGRVPTATPWQRTVRKSTEDPTLTIGAMTDISGSMRAAMLPMSVLSYVLSEAGYRVQARTAQVYYGNDVFPTLKPGQRLDQVVVRTAADGTERFDRAFKALDGALQLTRGTGARLLVISSDTYYTGEERKHFKKWVQRCVSKGVAVLVLPFDDGATVRSHGLPAAVKVLAGVTDPVKVAREIGHAAAQALTAAGRGA